MTTVIRIPTAKIIPLCVLQARREAREAPFRLSPIMEDIARTWQREREAERRFHAAEAHGPSAYGDLPCDTEPA